MATKVKEQITSSKKLSWFEFVNQKISNPNSKSFFVSTVKYNLSNEEIKKTIDTYKEQGFSRVSFEKDSTGDFFYFVR